MKRKLYIPNKTKIALLIISTLILTDIFFTNVVKNRKDGTENQETTLQTETVSMSLLEDYLISNNVKQINVNLKDDGLYIVPNGTMYHTGICPLIQSASASCIEITLEEAELSGYIACDKCH